VSSIHPRGRFKQRAYLTLLVAISALLGSPLSQGGEPSWLQFTQSVAERWSSEQAVFLGPVIAESIAALSSQMAVYLCDPRAASGCDRYHDPVVRERVIRSYLADLLQNRPVTTSVMERMFQAAGVNMISAGWPQGPWFNRFVTVSLTDLTKTGVSLSYEHWNRVERLPPDRSRALLSVGIHTFISVTPDGATTEYRVRVRREAGRAAIRIVSARTVPASGRFELVPARVEPQFERFCLDKPPDPSDPKYRLTTGRERPGIVHPADFHDAATIRILLEGDSLGCSVACRRWIGVLLVQALAEWRAGCALCLPSTLSMVEVAGDRYIAAHYVDWSQFVDDEGNPRSASQSQEFAYRMSTAWSAVGAISAWMGFQRLESGSDMSEVCSSTGYPSSQGNDLPPNTRARLCDPAPPTCKIVDGCKEILVQLGGSSTCTPDNLACGSPDQAVTINSSSFQFTLVQPDPAMGTVGLTIGVRSAAQGSRAIPLFPVLLHEVGHWFGLPHVDSDRGSDGREEVMVDTGGTNAVCISRAALNMVSNAVDQSWPFRLTKTAGLRYASP
jgi:hypothetical protein